MHALTNARWLLGFAAAICLVCGFVHCNSAAAPPTMTVDVRQAYKFALQNNPELATARQQRHLASAALVQARTYPFNPYLTVTPRAALGTFVEGVAQHIDFAGAVTLEVEMFGQKGQRIRAAEAGLSRTEWEIAAREFGVATKTISAFNTVIYREEKLKLLEENVRLAQQAMQDAKDTWKKKKENEPAGEAVLAEFEIQEAKAQLLAGRGPLTASRQDLRQVMGTLEEVAVTGTLEITYRDFREE